MSVGCDKCLIRVCCALKIPELMIEKRLNKSIVRVIVFCVACAR